MKDKWSKNSYITNRSHVFMGHLGANTFEYTICDDVKLEIWQTAQDLPELKKFINLM